MKSFQSKLDNDLKPAGLSDGKTPTAKTGQGSSSSGGKVSNNEKEADKAKLKPKPKINYGADFIDTNDLLKGAGQFEQYSTKADLLQKWQLVSDGYDIELDN